MTCQERMPAIRAAVVALALAAVRCSSAAPIVEGPGAEMRALTGAHTRVVWVQGDGSDPRASGVELVLMGFDSHDGKGERVILGTPGSYVKPLLTPSGDRIVFSSRAVPGPPEVFVVNWDGTGLRTLAGGFALACVEAPGTTAVSGSTSAPTTGSSASPRSPVSRSTRRTSASWSGTSRSSSMEGFRVSADGRHAGGLFPWPDARRRRAAERRDEEARRGMLDVADQRARAALLVLRRRPPQPDDGRRRDRRALDGEHQSRAEGFDGAEVFHPRWTNHPRFLAISGPVQPGRTPTRRGPAANRSRSISAASAKTSRRSRPGPA